MSGTQFTPVLKLALPPFDQIPWDEAVNTDFRIIDGAIASFFGVPNLVGIWKNGTTYAVGQSVVDSTDSSIWSCLVGHTSPAAPTTFSQDRTANPTRWTNIQAPARDFATQAANSAASAATSATSAATSATNAANSAATAANRVLRSGDTMTGPLILSGDPAAGAPLGAATKQYVDARVGGVGFLPTTGGTLTGALQLPIAAPTATTQATNKSYVDTQDALRLPLTGGTLTGALNLPAATPTGANQATTKSYVDSTAANQPFLKLTGGAAGQSVSGPITFTGQTVARNNILVQDIQGGNAVRPSVSVWKVAIGASVGMWNDSSVDAQGLHSFLSFGNTDGNGVPINGLRYFFCNTTGMFWDNGQQWFQAPGTRPSGVGTEQITIQQQFTGFSSAAFQTTGDWVFFSPLNNGTSGSLLYMRKSDNALLNPTGPIVSAGGFTVSDRRFKTNVVPMTYTIGTLMGLTPVEFDWLSVLDNSIQGHDCGFIASDVQPVFGEAVKVAGITAPDGTGGDPLGADPTLALSPMTLITLCIKCIQNIQTRLVAGGIP